MFVKLISKAFDYVGWDYPLSFCNIGDSHFAGGTGLRLRCPPLHLATGRPSPLLFILAIAPLHRLLAKATDAGLLSKLGRVARCIISLCADDVAIFIKPTQWDSSNLADLFTYFGEATGLQTNMQKISVVPIACRNINLNDILVHLPVAQASFPTKYLGLPLTTSCLRNIDVQFLLDKAAAKLSIWNGKNLNQAGVQA